MIVRARDERAERQAAAEGLGEHQHVGTDVPVLAGEPVAGAAEAGHHLVEDEQRADRVAARAQGGQEVVRRHAHAALALDRLDDDRGDRAVDARAARPRSPNGSKSNVAEQRLERAAVERVVRTATTRPSVSPW